MSYCSYIQIIVDIRVFVNSFKRKRLFEFVVSFLKPFYTETITILIGDRMIKFIVTIITLFHDIQSYEKLNQVSSLQNKIFEINYYVDKIEGENLLNSEQIDVNSKVYLYEIHPNKYLPQGYFKIPEDKIPIIVSEQKNIINIIYQKSDYYINYYYSKNYSLIDIGSKKNVNNLFYQRKKMQHDNKEALKIDKTFPVENYYKRMKFDYTVEYYYDGIIHSEETYQNSLYYGTEVRTYEDKENEEYIKEYTTIDEDALTITENLDANNIIVYYRKK